MLYDYVETITGQFKVISSVDRQPSHFVATVFQDPILGYAAEVAYDDAVFPRPRYKLTDIKLFDHSIESPRL